MENILLFANIILKINPVIPALFLYFINNTSQKTEADSQIPPPPPSQLSTSFIITCIQPDTRSVPISTDLYTTKKVLSCDAASIYSGVLIQSSTKSSARTG